MKSDFRPQSTRLSLTLFGTILLAAAFLPACFHRSRHQDMGVPVSANSQPDKMLFQKAQTEIDHGRYDVGRLTLQVLINTYPDSEYLAKAKLLAAESYYKQGGVSGLTQAEAEYKDFITFFPTAPEAPEAQYRAGMAHYRLMGKADRDLTEARAAEAEFKTFLEKYPDNSMVPAVKGRLRAVQEVLAQGDYITAQLYYRKGAQKAAASRFQEIADSYPNFSQADQALWYLGQAQEKLHKPDEAVSAYSRLVTDYPLSVQVKPAATRLVAMHKPVPKASKATLARARADRVTTKQSKQSLTARVEGLFTTAPDMSATRHGPVHLGEHPAAVEQAQAQKNPAAVGSIAVQPVPGSGSTGQAQAPPSDHSSPNGDSGSNPSSPNANSPSDRSSSSADSADPPASANAPDANAGPSKDPTTPNPATNAGPPKSAATTGTSSSAPDTGAPPEQPGSSTSTGQQAEASATAAASKSAKSADSGSSAPQKNPSDGTTDPPKKGKFHFLKKLVPF